MCGQELKVPLDGSEFFWVRATGNGQMLDVPFYSIDANTKTETIGLQHRFRPRKSSKK
jgi:hypothetical protein